MKKNKIMKIIIISLIVIILSVAIFFVVRNLPSENVDIYKEKGEIKITGLLKEYMTSLKDNYYIKYSGKFHDNNSKLVQAVIEYTKEGKNFAIKSIELDMHLIGDDSKIYTISDKYKLMVELPKDTLNINEYNFISDFGQEYVKTYEEKLNKVKYTVEEYMYNGKQVKYYFKDNEVKVITYDGQEINVIRVELNAKTELLEKPKGYTIQK